MSSVTAAAEPPLGRAPTTNEALRARIAELVALARAGDVSAFVEKFVPRDIDADDAEAFEQSLREDTERLAFLRRELELVDAGEPGCRACGGDGVKRAVFRFEMPSEGTDLERSGVIIDREVTFVDYAEAGEPSDWRAEG